MANKIQLLDANKADQKLTRLAYEIYENNIEAKEILLIGLYDRGLDLAQILKAKLNAICNINILIETLHIDKKNPIDCHLDNKLNLTGKTIILVDDVANSGKTMTYALRPLLDTIAKKIQVAVLIDRQHKKYPIASDFIGFQLSTTIQNHITVEIENGSVKGAYIE
jgi:pyrimidine operon attenuation protein/uracil phosphoribosyltransferase